MQLSVKRRIFCIFSVNPAMRNGVHRKAHFFRRGAKDWLLRTYGSILYPCRGYYDSSQKFATQ